MKEAQYISYKNKEDIAMALIDWIENWLDDVKDHPAIHIAISGGNTPKILFKYLAQSKHLDLFKNVHFWWVDERCVPMDDPESNFLYFNEYFVKPTGFSSEQVHPIDGTNNPDSEAMRYGELIETHISKKDTWPIFDLILLGMGDDGHTASIFPHQIEYITSQEICVVATHPITKQKRISLTGSVINRSKQVIFLVTGADKKDIFNEIKNQSTNAIQYPAYHIQSNKPVLWFIDKDVE
ncbi:6-phosphogluconolactonase [Halosquirtibacter laminarini]|uniref:6-phosphogluconolactonase n=1 Tax=Halosquirtibacter laminarini TaxID=3374600 RepID=A0AC61NL99_9BACT|nr:6-phosphogluconolactonase [Prolixibacteraceae bacterium]